ncbi:hypothetical protein AAMO2058_000692100 [Amorphochlora amoebiformis]
MMRSFFRTRIPLRRWMNSFPHRPENRTGGFFSRVLAVPKRFPAAFAMLFTGFKTFSADIFVQKVLERSDEINWKRTSVFAIFGLTYQGAFQYFVYVKIVAGRLLPNAGKYAAKTFSEKLRDPKGAAQLLGQVGIANLIMDPFLCLPSYYITKEAILGEKKEGQGFFELAKGALAKYRGNMFEDVTTSWKIWVPAQLLNFGLMPLHLRVPFISVVSFGYCIVLSLMRGAEEDQKLPAKDIQAFQRNLACEMRSSLITDIRQVIANSTDGNGHLDKAAFISIFKKLGMRNEVAIERLYVVFDLDSNGNVTPEEFATLILSMTNGAPSRRLAAIFEVCDLNGDGVVNKDEMQTMLRAVLRMESNLLVDRQFVGLIAGLTEQAKEKAPPPSILETDKRASELAETVMREAKLSNPNVITPSEFRDWAEAGSESAQNVLRLFRAFQPHAHPQILAH